jgi:tetratricopeptide (TPR) repeat protein
MQEANAQNVLGDFSGVSFSHRDTKARFFQRDGGYWINTDGPDGKPADFRVKNTFGLDPLQQYLLELPGGRLQAFTVAWDAERKRWFDLFPNERIDFHDELHWSRPSQNWNYMCAECHSTDLHKNYDAATRTYNTTYARVNVGCQACHGPGSGHVDWAKQYQTGSAGKRPDRLAFEVDLRAHDSNVQIETCARCHSRRAAFWGEYRYGARLMDQHLPALLEPGLYHADGQIQGEVYEYGSFLQSRMYAKGVRCSDCHDAHALKPRAPGNALCTTCHNATGRNSRAEIDTAALQRKDYDSPTHHFHKAGGPGAQCVDCHMPSRTYMLIDPRLDHSLRIPRPDLSVKLGTPNACNVCHADKNPQWAADAVAKWYGPARRQEAHFGEAILAGRTHQPGASAKLAALAHDGAQPDIARATALELLASFPGEAAATAFRDALSHSDPMIRRAALQGVDAMPPGERNSLASARLTDPVRAVRMEAARMLSSNAPKDIGQDRMAAFNAALAEYEAAQRENADRPESHLNLGTLYAGQRKFEQAHNEYRIAIELDPHFVPAYVNLADLERSRGAEAAAEQILREGLVVAPDNAALRHALGLTLIRERRYPEALSELARATRQATDDVRYAYVYGVALHDSGKKREGMTVLRSALARHPGDRDLLQALAGYAHESGDAAAAAQYEQRLRTVDEPRSP